MRASTNTSIKELVTGIMASIAMTEGTALLRLLTWLSPAFPVGSFAYSHGLERAIAMSLVHDQATLENWLSDLIDMGSARTDAVLCALSFDAAANSNSSLTDDLIALAEALASSRERHLESINQGRAFMSASDAWIPTDTLRTGLPIAYPVAVGLVAGHQKIEKGATLTAFLHAFASNLVQAAIRLVPLGQKEGVLTLARLEDRLAAAAIRATTATIDDLGSATVVSDIMSMQHETQQPRLFQT